MTQVNLISLYLSVPGVHISSYKQHSLLPCQNKTYTVCRVEVNRETDRKIYDDACKTTSF